MRIAYVLPRPELSGGIKVVFQHARLLRERGFEVTLLGEGPFPSWVPGPLAYHDYRTGAPDLPRQDLVIGTFWSTLPLARTLVSGPLAHFCQGYEGGMPHLAPVLPQIEVAYSERLPTITVTPQLGDFLRERFGRVSTAAPPPLDPLFRPSWRLRPSRRPWIAVPGIFESEVKGIPTALEAVRRLRDGGLPCRVLRTSILPLSEAERRILEPDLYLHAVSPEEVARSLRRCDLLLFPSQPAEGFGLPVLEAMASKVPVVASRIPSMEFLGPARQAAIGDAEAFAAAARELLTEGAEWRRARRDGFRASRRFLPGEVSAVLERAVRWAREQALEGPEGSRP